MRKRTEIAALADQFEILAAHGRQLEGFASTYDLEIGPTAQSLRIDPAEFQDFSARISFDRFSRLLEALAVISGDATFGLKYGEYFEHGSTGPYGYGLSNAPTFGDALRFIIKYTPVQVDFEELSLVNKGDEIVIEWRFPPLIMQLDQFSDFSAVVILRQLNACAGKAFRLLGAQLMRRSPQDEAAYHKWFGRHVRFGADVNQVIIPHDLLQVQNRDADAVLFNYMSLQCQEATKARNRAKDIVTIVKEDLVQHLKDQDVSLPIMARRNGMSERTLQRRLEQAGTSFLEVYEDTRDEISMHLLSNTRLPLAEVSLALGYASQSAYTRFVKRRRGVAPGQIRAQVRQQQAQ